MVGRTPKGEDTEPELSLPELLSELIPDHGAREYISKLTGLQLDLDPGTNNNSGDQQ